VEKLISVYRRACVQTVHEDGSYILKDTLNGAHVRLEGAGRRIWELLEYPCAMPDIAGKLAGEFSESIDVIAEETQKYIQQMVERGLVEQSDELPTAIDEQRYRYLWLLKRALVNLIYPEHELRIRYLEEAPSDLDKLERMRFLRDIRYRQPDRYASLIDAKLSFGPTKSAPLIFPHTMIGLPALDNIERCAEQIFKDGIAGDFMEAGVCQGGATIFLRALQVAYGQQQRRTWVADSFQGLPPPQTEPDIQANIDLSESKFPSFAASLEIVRDNFDRYNLLDDRVCFLSGWFSETLPSAPVGQLALLRLDADLYGSTRDILTSLYDKVSPGGFILVDDYGTFAVCRQAVDEFREERSIADPLMWITGRCVYWRKMG
jgi:O-methyltransferase